MPKLDETDRRKVWSDYMTAASSSRDPIPLTKLQLRAAFNSVDDWIDINAASFNSALPVEARTSLTAKQKIQLFVFVARRRLEVT